MHILLPYTWLHWCDTGIYKRLPDGGLLPRIYQLLIMSLMVEEDTAAVQEGEFCAPPADLEAATDHVAC